MEENNVIVQWAPTDMLEIILNEPDDFLKVRETLTRIGAVSRKEQKQFQWWNILHKQGKYYIVHFKELFALDGKATDISENDISRRNTIANLLEDWELIKLVKPEKSKEPTVSLTQIKIITHKEKDDWILEAKYSIGSKKKVMETE